VYPSRPLSSSGVTPFVIDTLHASTHIPGARIDLYLIQCKTYMSEVTMTTQAGGSIVKGQDCVGACAKRVEEWLGSLISREMPLESRIRRHHLDARCTSQSYPSTSAPSSASSSSAKPISPQIATLSSRNSRGWAQSRRHKRTSHPQRRPRKAERYGIADVLLYRRWPAFLGEVERFPAASQSVTLVTQCSVDRFPQLIEQAVAYGNAPISVAVYIPYDSSEHVLLQRIRRLHQGLADRGSRRVTVSLLFGNAPSNKTYDDLYPVNALRNVALLVMFLLTLVLSAPGLETLPVLSIA
jgi:hypothetical protein